MRYISKTKAPDEYTNWCDTQRNLGLNYNYRRLPGDIKRKFLSTLLLEQGFICGYTMKRIDANTTHVEHIKPQHICIIEGPGVDLDYFNLIACFPKEGMKSHCRYGAQAKDKWWQNGGTDFLSPVKDNCETELIFNLNGEINPRNNWTNRIRNTINVLKLDDPSLTNDRKKSIQEFVFGDDGTNPLSPEDVEVAIDKITKPNSEGILPEFCIAIRDALNEYVNILGKI